MNGCLWLRTTPFHHNQAYVTEATLVKQQRRGPIAMGTNQVIRGWNVSPNPWFLGRGEGLEVESITKANDLINCACVTRPLYNYQGQGSEGFRLGEHVEVQRECRARGHHGNSRRHTWPHATLPSGYSWAISFIGTGTLGSKMCLWVLWQITWTQGGHRSFPSIAV